MTGARETALILYNTPQEAGGSGATPWAEADAGVLNAVEAVAEALRQNRIPFSRLGVRRLSDIPEALSAAPGAAVVNLVERLDGRVSDFNQVPAVCEALRHPCTGNPSTCLELTLDKWIMKARLRAGGIATPDGAVVPPGEAAGRCRLPPPPFLVKPLCSDGSEGIHAHSLIRDAAGDAESVVRQVHERCGQPALVESYIEGREFNLSVLERDGRVEVLPIAEIDFSLFPPGRPHIVDYDVKWVAGTIPGHVSPRRVPAAVNEPLASELRRVALAAWRACGCADYVRVDCRADAAGRPFVLEVNANPDLSPKAGFPASLAAAGISFADFVASILSNARRRQARAAGAP